MTVHQDVVSNDATIINPNSSPKTRRRILFLSLEFNFSPFSGNGVLARSLVSSLVRRDDCTVRVICARPHRSAPGISQDIFMTTTSSNSSNDDDLEIWPVDLPQHSQWKRLDRSGPWQEYATACGEDYEQRLGSFARLVNEFQPTDVVAVDWHGMLAWESILRSNKRRGDVMTVGNNGTSSSSSWQPSSVNVCYYNFRVYSSSSWGHSSTTTSQSDKAEKEESDDQFYREREQLSCRLANVIICLAEHDKCMIQRLVEDDDNAAQKEEPMERNIKNIHILHPPLRGDLRQLANTNETVERLNHHLPPEVKHAIEKTSISKQRLFITCMARLSPEKSPHHFVSLLQKLGGIDFLRRNELIPIICGARGVQDYAMKVVDDFQSMMCSDSSEEGETTTTSWPCVVIDRHLGPKELGAMFSRTVVNFHPCLYDAYGMTMVEAAAFGAPSLVNSGGKVGAVSLLGEGEGKGCIAVDIEKMLGASDDGNSNNNFEAQKIIDSIGKLLTNDSQKDTLSQVAKVARCQALGWDEMACCQGLIDILNGLPNS